MLLLFQKTQECHEAINKGEQETVNYVNNLVADIKRNVPKERLLVMSEPYRWEPICKFLNVQEPDVPFPHIAWPYSDWVSKVGEHLKVIRNIIILGSLAVVVLPIMVATSTYLYLSIIAVSYIKANKVRKIS